MGVSNEIFNKIEETTREVSGKISEKYRSHIGDELLKKEKRLNAFEALLKEREKIIAETELNQKRAQDVFKASLADREKVVKEIERKQNSYYHIPKYLIRIPAAIAITAFGAWIYNGLESQTQPPPRAVETEINLNKTELVSGSDDYWIHSHAFINGATKLISEGKCSEDDFREMGGWVKSTTTYSNRPVYFVYCGGMKIEDRIYLDASSGRIFK